MLIVYFPLACLHFGFIIIELTLLLFGIICSTFGGNPLASAVAVASLDVIRDERLAERYYICSVMFFSIEITENKSWKVTNEVLLKYFIFGHVYYQVVEN